MECLRPLAILCLTLFLAATGRATEYYVSYAGAGTHSGLSESNSMTVAEAISTYANGDTLSLLPGVYTNTSMTIARHFVTIQAKYPGLTRLYGAPALHCIAGSSGYHTNTIKGLIIESSYLDCIKPAGHGWTIENNIIRNSAKGDPASVTNTSGTYQGNGIGWHNYSGTVVRRNLIEDCGRRLNLDHGIYGSGTNCVIEFNIIRDNMCWGITLYDSTGDSHGNIIRGNIIYGNGGIDGSSGGALSDWMYSSSKTNYATNNIFIGTRNAVNPEGPGTLILRNNFIIAGNGYNTIVTNTPVTVDTDYNFVNQNLSLEPDGPHDVQQSTYTLSDIFPAEAQGRFWITSNSVARGAALATAITSPDWFGLTETTHPDIGVLSYDAELEADDRDLEASTGSDPWMPPPDNVTVDVNSSRNLVSWTVLGTRLLGSQVWRKVNSGSYSKIADIGSTTNSYADTSAPLEDGTTYYYKVTQTNYWGRGPWSAVAYSITPSIARVRSSLISSNSAVISWATDQSSSSKVTYNGVSTAVVTNLVRYHSMTLSNLSPSTTYNYTVSSSNSNGTLSSGTNTFTTVAIGYTTVSSNRFFGGGL